MTIVDDNLEEIIEQNNIEVQANDPSKDEANENLEISEESEESSSDEYVPKTPTINMEGSDGTEIEFSSISEYKQYQTKFDEESFENVEEEIVSTNWIDESIELKEEQSSNEENFVNESRKRKFNVDSLDEASSSSIDKGNTSEDGKSMFDSNNLKLFKMHKEDNELDSTSEHHNEEDNSSSPDKSPDMSSSKHKSSDSESTNKSKHSSSSKDSVKSHRHHHSHIDRKDDDNPETRSNSAKEKEHRDRSHREKNDDKHDPSKHRLSKKYETSSSKHGESHKSRHEGKSKERTTDKKLEVDCKDKNLSDGDKKESHHEHKEKHYDNHDKDRGKQDRDGKSTDGKKDIESSHRHEKDKKDSSKKSKDSHSSSKHHHKSSSDKYKIGTDSKHRESSSSKHSSNNKKKEKDDKHKSKPKYRDHCKSNDKDGEGRRSSDRDSSGPSGRSTSSSHSRESSGRSKTETTADTSDKMSSNSDNVVSEQLETVEVDASSPNTDREQVASSKQVTTDHSDVSVVSNSKQIDVSNEEFQSSNFDFDNENNNKKSEIDFSCQIETVERTALKIGVTNKSVDERGTHEVEHNESLQKSDTDMDVDNECDSCNTPILVQDSSSEKENIEQAVNCSVETEDSKVVKFKKPKIAANIFEVKKIMQARRNIKRLETIRLSKSTSEDEEIGNSSNDKLMNEDKDSFKGFEDVVSNKNEEYKSLIERLSNEIDNIPKTHVPKIVTSWMEFDAKYDNYITNTLNVKVHRKERVCVPPICEEFYEYDMEHKLYILRDNIDIHSVTKDSVEEVSGEHFPISDSDGCTSKTYQPKVREALDSSNLSSHDCTSQVISQLSKTQNRKVDEEQADLSSITSDMSSSRLLSLSYNTYEDYIKNKETNKVSQDKAPTPPRMVVKITNKESSEQVIMKNEETDRKKTCSIPRITRMNTKANGQVPKVSIEQKQMPLISRVKKEKATETEPNKKTHSLNGAVSPDSTTNSEVGNILNS